MIISMHCQPICSRDFSSCTSSFYFLRPIGPTEYFSSYSHSILTPRRRRRLEDPIVSHASNYYASYPHGTTTAAVTSITHPSSIPSTHHFEKEIDRKVLYCDLYNLLEIPESSATTTTTTTTNTIKSRRRTNYNEGNTIRRHHQNERKRSTYHKEKKHSDEIKEKSMKTNEIYSRRSSPTTKGFFRRVMRQYFCLPASMANNGYSS